MGTQHKFPIGTVLLLLKTVYGLKQAANAFYRLLVASMEELGYVKSSADPCLYFKWDKKDGLLVWISWCDDLVLFGANKEVVLREVARIKNIFEVDDAGPLSDYLGCKLDINLEERSYLITHPLLVQSLKDEYQPYDKAVPLPANPRTVLRKAKAEEGVEKKSKKSIEEK